MAGVHVCVKAASFSARLRLRRGVRPLVDRCADLTRASHGAFVWTAYHASILQAPSRRPQKPAAASSLMNTQDLERLVTLAMPFGKYKGRLIADLPGHYLNWFAREGFPPGQIGQLLALMQELDHNGLRALLEPLRDAKRTNDFSFTHDRS